MLILLLLLLSGEVKGRRDGSGLRLELVSGGWNEGLGAWGYGNVGVCGLGMRLKGGGGITPSRGGAVNARVRTGGIQLAAVHDTWWS